MLIQMHTMVTGYNGHFTMIPMYAPYPFMKQVAIYFLEQEISMNVVKEKDMVIPLISQSMHSLKMNHFLIAIRTSL